MLLKLTSAKGFFLIESMVTLAVVSVAFLGLAASQLTASKNNYSALVRTESVIYSDTIIERMRSNVSGVRSSSYNIDNLRVFGNSVFTVNDQASQDLSDWRDELMQSFDEITDPIVSIDCDTKSVIDCTFTIQWNDSNTAILDDSIALALKEHKLVSSASFR